MKQLRTSNDILGDPAALHKRWEKDGYWYLTDVLPHAPIQRLRDRALTHLRKVGLTDPEGPLGNYNGGDVAKLDLAGFEEARPWRDFVAEPEIIAFFATLTGEEPQWIPVGECRMSPPSNDPDRPRFDFIHSDGFFNPGTSFRTCWIPLMDVDEDMGGLALAAGMAEPMIIPPPTDGLPTITPEQVDPDRWHRANYRVGDVLLFDPKLAHSGLVNHSNRFRMSVDIRLSTDRENFPLVGKLLSFSPDALEVETEVGCRKLVISDQTLCRDEKGARVESFAIGERFPPGSPILVATKDDHAVMVRAPK